ncbi:hypothetical protein CN692_13365 [Bacillus sp. AFS002410]|uniref:hypothetical protein n=1 Tax=Bacillus sp. AFS002410 TaxID=2033481 RepID=UPI000BF086B4|nr:hypothetical protein [Bacillus sp. AFS002410]PEJ57397.1 hypothetical protein CN692_13365 [Bacillus sp. AFS002410]
MMYYYWKTKGVFPSVFKRIKDGEWQIIRAFYELEIEERNQFLSSGAFPVIPV